jgi:hypothetical protein
MQTAIRLAKAGPVYASVASERQASNTVSHLDFLMISGMILNKFLIKKGGKANVYRYSFELLTVNTYK